MGIRTCLKLAAGLSAMLVMGSAVAGFVSHRDLAPLPEIYDGAACPKTGAEPLDADWESPIEGLIGGATLTYVQARANLQAVLEASATKQAVEALRASAVVKDPVAAERLAAGALAQEKPIAALGLLLASHQNAPNDPLGLVNLAGISNYLGLHREALAMIGKAESLNPPDVRVGALGLRSLLLSNKGYALVATGRPVEAEAVLQQAIRNDPDLSEAYTNIAYALGDQDKCDRALKFLRAGNTRRPADVVRIREPMSRLPPAEVIDLSRGKAVLIPAMPLPGDPVEAASGPAKKHLEQINKRAMPELNTAMEQQMKSMLAAQQQRMKWLDGGAAGRLSAERAEWLMGLSMEYAEMTTIVMNLGGVPGQVGARYDAVLGGARPEEIPIHPDPELQPKVEAQMRARLEMLADDYEASERFGRARGEFNRQFSVEDNNCIGRKDENLCHRAAALRRDTGICKAAKEAAGKRLESMRTFDAAFRDLFTDASKRLSAVVSHFGDAAHHAEGNARLQSFALEATLSLAGQVGSFVHSQSQGADACKAADKRMVDLLFEYLRDLEANRCDPKGNSGKISVGVVEVGANCEEVSLGAQTPGWLGLFVKVSYEQSLRYEYVKAGKERFLAQQAGLDGHVRPHFGEYGAAFDGKLTVYAGGFAKAEAGGVGVDAKAGGSFTVDGNGNVGDFSRQTEVSASGTVGGKGVSGGGETTIYKNKERLAFSPSRSSD